MIEQYGLYEYCVLNTPEGWEYLIFDKKNQPNHKIFFNKTILRESGEVFESEQQARFAAIGHIDLLEKGENE